MLHRILRGCATVRLSIVLVVPPLARPTCGPCLRCGVHLLNCIYSLSSILSGISGLSFPHSLSILCVLVCVVCLTNLCPPTSGVLTAVGSPDRREFGPLPGLLTLWSRPLSRSSTPGILSHSLCCTLVMSILCHSDDSWESISPC